MLVQARTRFGLSSSEFWQLTFLEFFLYEEAYLEKQLDIYLPTALQMAQRYNGSRQKGQPTKGHREFLPTHLSDHLKAQEHRAKVARSDRPVTQQIQNQQVAGLRMLHETSQQKGHEPKNTNSSNTNRYQ